MTQSAEGVSKKDYKTKWDSHINQLSGLAWNLPKEDRDRLAQIKFELRQLVDKAAENREEARND